MLTPRGTFVCPAHVDYKKEQKSKLPGSHASPERLQVDSIICIGPPTHVIALAPRPAHVTNSNIRPLLGYLPCARIRIGPSTPLIMLPAEIDRL